METMINFLAEKTQNFMPEIGLILGSGLGDFADEFCEYGINYSEIPNFSCSKIIGHKNRLVFGKVGGKKVVAMQGRFHYYEGYTIEQVILPIKVFKKLGIKTLIITNAAGLVNTDFKVGNLMIIKDHINLFGVDPLRGENDENYGTRFPDMSEIYKKYLIKIAENAAKELNLTVYQGVYCGRSGPCYETPAEIYMSKIIGADAVGMSTVPEAIYANYCGINVLGISCLTNYAAGISDIPLSHDEVTQTANVVRADFSALLYTVIEKI